jgi:hypothetical protein
MFRSALVVSSAFAASLAFAEGIPIPLSGYNWDGIANGAPTNNNPPAVQASTTGTLDGIYCYFERGFWSLDANVGLPPDGKVTSDVDNLTRFKIEPASGNNLLLLRNLVNPSGTLTLVTPASYRKLHLLVTGFNGSLPGRYVLHFSDLTTFNGNFAAPDNFNQVSWAIRGFGRVDRNNDGAFANPSLNPRMYQVTISLSGLNSMKTLTSVELFNDDATGLNHHNIGIFGISGVPTTADSMPIAVTGFDFDGIADGGPVVNDPLAVQASTDGDLDSQYVYFAQGFWLLNPAIGLPASGTILSALDGGSIFQLRPYNGPNMLLLRQAGSGQSTKTLTLTSPDRYSRLSFLVTGFNGRQPLQYTLNFLGGGTFTDTIFASDNFNTPDFAMNAFGRVSRTTGVFQNDGSNPRIYQADVWLSPTEASQVIQSITFTNAETTGVSARNIGVFAVSGVPSSSQTTISGRIAFGDRLGNFPSAVDIEFKDPNNPAIVIHTATGVTVAPDGTYGTADLPPNPGSYLVAVKPLPWLRKTVGPLHTGSSHVGVDFSLTNGDIDDDNEVAIGDYALLSTSFGSAPGDPNWDPASDLDGDDEVTIGDYAILSQNFGMIGDE